jgi:hypothetical protein
LAGDIRGRFPGDSAGDEPMVLFSKPGGLGLMRRHEILRGIPSEDVFGEHPSAQVGLNGADPSVSQHLACDRDALVNSGHLPSEHDRRVFEFF